MMQAQTNMDHLRKALEKAESTPATVRDWMQPVKDQPSERAAGSTINVPDSHVVKSDRGSFSANRLIAASNENPAVLDRYRVLRTRVHQAMKAGGWQFLAITSSAPQAGKTLTTLNLGVTFARAETQRVIIIDADMRKPSIAGLFGISPRYGLVDYLRGSTDLSSIIYQPAEFDNLSVIPGVGTEPAANPSELLASNRLDNLMKALRTTGAIVLVDTPPLQVGDDVLAIAQRVDCFLLVIEEGQTTVDEMREAARLLHDRNLIGTVLNKSSEQPKRFQSYYASKEEESPRNSE